MRGDLEHSNGTGLGWTRDTSSSVSRGKEESIDWYVGYVARVDDKRCRK